MIMMNLNLDYDDDFAESERKWNALCARKVIRWKSRECATITRRMMNERIRLFCKSRHQVTGTQTSLLKRKIRCNRMKSGRFEAFDELMMSFIDCDRYTKTFKNSKMRHEESREEKKKEFNRKFFRVFFFLSSFLFGWLWKGWQRLCECKKDPCAFWCDSSLYAIVHSLTQHAIRSPKTTKVEFSIRVTSNRVFGLTFFFFFLHSIRECLIYHSLE